MLLLVTIFALGEIFFEYYGMASTMNLNVTRTVNRSTTYVLVSIYEYLLT